MRLLVGGCTKTLRRLLPGNSDVLGRFLTPDNGNAVIGLVNDGLPWACDNSAYKNFNVEKYCRMVQRVAGQPRLMWVACPDVVGKARETMEHWYEWEPWLCEMAVPVAFVLQDGQEDLELPAVGAYFIGGSTKWKLSEAAADLAAEVKRRGALLHMGRVNSLKRLRAALDIGCDTVDGTGMSTWGSIELPKMIRWLRQVLREREQQTMLW